MKKALTYSFLTIAAFTAITTASVAEMSTAYSDWVPQTSEEQQVVNWLGKTGAMLGYTDGSFHPWEIVTSVQVVRVCNRMGISDIDEGMLDYTPVTMGWIESNFLPGTVKSAPAFEFCTRYRFATMLYRYFQQSLVINPIKAVVEDPLGIRAQRLNVWFDNQAWNGKQNKFQRLGHVFVEESIRHNVPVQLALCCAWAESCWGAADNPEYNITFGIKASPDKWGEISGLVIRGFGNYVTQEECVRAYFRYMDGQTKNNGESLYRKYIDAGDWRSIINIYAPSYENDTNAMYNTYMVVKGWCEERGIEW